MIGCIVDFFVALMQLSYEKGILVFEEKLMIESLFNSDLFDTN